MSRTETLKSLEIVLESFLERAVRLREDRIRVLDGINRLDDIARGFRGAENAARPDLTDRIGHWFAEHQGWLDDPKLRPAERNRIQQMLGEIGTTIESSGDTTPAVQKIASEIDRWRRPAATAPSAETAPGTGRKIILRRSPESAEPAKSEEPEADSITLFFDALRKVTNRFRDSIRSSKHLMSVLDDNLKAAQLQRNPDALLLSAVIIYHLKQRGYLVEPFVKRLKEAEQLQKETASRA